MRRGRILLEKIFDDGPTTAPFRLFVVEYPMALKQTVYDEFGHSKNHFAIRAMSIEMAANANKPQAEPARGTIEKTKAGFLTR